MSTLVACVTCAPPTVVQFNINVVFAVSWGVCATPFTEVNCAFAALKAERPGLEITHDCIPLVTHPMTLVSPGNTAVGLATSTIVGFPICTLHCAPAVWPPFVHVSV